MKNLLENSTIADASEKIGVSSDTIRYWEKKGLIKTRRSEDGRRLFSIQELERLKNKLSGTTVNEFSILASEEISSFSVVELFAGAGGLALGMENAGLNTKLLVEIDKNAAQTLRENRPNWNVVEDDVVNVNFKDVRADIITGGFPCQSFSYVGKGLGFEDVRGTLFFEYARAIDCIKPKIMVGENVRGLEKHDEGRTLKTMLHILDELGYRVEYQILRSQYLDVPQKRERLVMIGVRKDLDLPICFPKEQDYTVSLREALVNVPPSPGQTYTKTKYEVMSLVPEGGYWRDLPMDVREKYMGASFHLGGGKTGMARRLAWDEPSLTLTCNPAQKQTERCHPSETRPLNIREYARLQSFPDNWIFTGSTASQYKQIGNAVPVNLGYHIGRCLIAMLMQKPDVSSMVVIPQMQH
jgi:DNA (cytosine-5)-methyltransferase 1